MEKRRSREAAMSSIVTRPISYADLLEMPEGNGDRYEIIGGELFVSASPILDHQRVSHRLTRIFDEKVTDTGLGELFYAPVDVKFSEYDVVVPDLVIVATEHQDIAQGDYIAGPPDLIVEILSPSTRRIDLLRKSALYATMGVPEYWLVDLKVKTINVLTLENGVYEQMPQEPHTVRSLVFPNLTVDLKALSKGIP
jgi:Uma2 family endonuclease